MDTKELDARLATLQGFLADANKERDKALAAADTAKETLRAFIVQICAEKNITSPAITEETKVDQVAKIAISFFQGQTEEFKKQVQNPAVQQELLQLQTAIEKLKLANDTLLTKNERLNSTVHAETTTEDHPTVSELVDSQTIEPNTPEGLTGPENVSSSSIAGAVLKLAGSCRLLKLDDLIELCSKELHLSITVIEEQITILIDEGVLESFKTLSKSIPGYTYPTLFRLTQRGLDAVNIPTASETDRIIESIKITQDELPLLVFAVEDYLPKHGYSLVSYSPEITYTNNENQPCLFVPHILLTDPKGEEIYLMYEGSNFYNGENLQRYIKDYGAATNGNAYFLCLNSKTVSNVSGKFNFLTHNREGFQSVNFTNIADWTTYERMIKTGDKTTPSTIWFGRLFK